MNDRDYEIWNERSVISDCLRKLGLASLASEVHTQPLNGDIIVYIHLIQEIAEKNKDNDVLDRLYFAGLIYG